MGDFLNFILLVHESFRKIYSDILYKDIIVRYKIQNVEEFKSLAIYILSNFANLFTYSALKRAVQIADNHTVSNYVSYLENSYLIFTLSKFNYKLKITSNLQKILHY